MLFYYSYYLTKYISSISYKSSGIVSKCLKNIRAMCVQIIVRIIAFSASSTSKAYEAFMFQISSNLTPAEKQHLILGSDEELAIKQCLPTATHVLCTRHLKNNINKYMEDNAKLNLTERKNIIELIFGETGIINSKDNDTYASRVERLKKTVILQLSP